MLKPDEIALIENLLLEFHGLHARHRFGIGLNEELRRHTGIKTESTYTHQSKRYHYHSAFFEIRKSHICSEETHWQLKYLSRFSENQPFNIP